MLVSYKSVVAFMILFVTSLMNDIGLTYIIYAYRISPTRNKHGNYNNMRSYSMKEKFGDKFDLVVKLPTVRGDIARSYISPKNILAAVWREGKYTAISPDSFQLSFDSFDIPGFGSITPVTDVTFIVSSNSTIFMQSEKFMLQGNSILLKDSAFTNSFRFNLRGEFYLTPYKVDKPLALQGYVEYQVEGNVPKLLKISPLLMRNMIKLIQNILKQFVTREFSTKIINGLKKYMLTSL
jgi:hypothetical protein